MNTTGSEERHARIAPGLPLRESGMSIPCFCDRGAPGRYRGQSFPRSSLSTWMFSVLRRAVLKMPAYEKHLEPRGVPALWAYTWLRSEASRESAKPMEEHDHE